MVDGGATPTPTQTNTDAGTGTQNATVGAGQATTTPATAGTGSGQASTDATTLLGQDGGDTSATAAAAQADNAKKDKGSADTTAPEAYEPFTVPEGMAVDQKMVDAFSPIAKELGLSQENAQKLVDVYSARMQAEHAEVMSAFSQQRETWRAEVKAKPGYEQELAAARRVLNSDLVPQSLRDLVTGQDSWLGDHPGLIEFLAKVGKLTSEDSMLRGGTTAAQKTAAALFYTKKPGR